MRILVIDNYDSFVYNLVQYIGQLGFADEVDVWRNTDARLGLPGEPHADDALRETLKEYAAILISPGPGEPTQAGQTMRVIAAAAAAKIPLFGVCLGHQAIGLHCGGDVVRANELFHGKTSPVEHDGTGALRDIPSPFRVTRYHSLTVARDTLPEELIVTAYSDSGMIMAMRHRDLPIHSVQFHPESVMTQYGHRMLANWLEEAGFMIDQARLRKLEEEQLRVTGAISSEASVLL